MKDYCALYQFFTSSFTVRRGTNCSLNHQTKLQEMATKKESSHQLHLNGMFSCSFSEIKPTGVSTQNKTSQPAHFNGTVYVITEGSSFPCIVLGLIVHSIVPPKATSEERCSQLLKLVLFLPYLQNSIKIRWMSYIYRDFAFSATVEPWFMEY